MSSDLQMEQAYTKRCKRSYFSKSINIADSNIIAHNYDGNLIRIKLSVHNINHSDYKHIIICTLFSYQVHRWSIDKAMKGVTNNFFPRFCFFLHFLVLCSYNVHIMPIIH